MLRKTFLCLVVLAAIEVSAAQAVMAQDTASKPQPNRSGTWSARSSGGLTLIGRWTAVPDSATGNVLGTWTVVDAQGRTLAGGGWSAAKSPTQWNGAWRAIVTGRDGEHSGTWTASVDLKSDGRIVDLFEKAIDAVVSGTWRAGTQSGAWSIRAAPKEAKP